MVRGADRDWNRQATKDGATHPVPDAAAVRVRFRRTLRGTVWFAVASPLYYWLVWFAARCVKSRTLTSHEVDRAKIHHAPIADITTPLVLGVLKPIWVTKSEIASRLRGRIERVLSWAVSQSMGGDLDLDHYRNPARWDDHLEHALANQAKVHEVEHHAALDHAQIPAFYAALSKQPGLAALAFQLAILTATRNGDLRGVDREERPPMRWEHFDLAARMWTVPKTKTGVEHRIPLSKQAVDLLEQFRQGRTDGIVFPGGKRGQPMSNGAMLAVVKRMAKAGLIEKGSVTPHGMARAGFKSWSADQDGYDKDVTEACMSHVISDKVEAAYRRTDFYAKRAKLMQAWADYVTGV
jgi:integrase